MLVRTADYIQRVELTELSKQIYWMIDGGEDVCCAMEQWGIKWGKINTTEPLPDSENGRIFVNQFVQPFE
jgi:hypothetical protein